MKKIRTEVIKEKVEKLVVRFPLTVIFMGILTYYLLRYSDYFDLLGQIHIVNIFGILLTAIAQFIFESFFTEKPRMRWLLYGGSLLLVFLVHIFMWLTLPQIDRGYFIAYSIPGLRLMILYFMTLVAFVWVPTIRQPLKFSRNFLVVFRTLYSSFFFSLLLFLGVAATLGLFQFLFFSLSGSWYTNVGIIIFAFLFPSVFFSQLPDYTQLESEIEAGAFQESKFLNILISFVFIPVTGVFSILLLVYLLTNFPAILYTESLIEGMALAYTINGWIILLLADNLDSQMAKWFCRIYPYSLVLVVILQMFSTMMRIRYVGVTHGRYFLLLFGLGTIISALWYIFRKQEFKILPVVALVAALIALIPPFDAMSVSVRQQKTRINDTLKEYGMLNAAGEITRVEELPSFVEENLQDSIRYLSNIHAANQLDWLPGDYYYRPLAYLQEEAFPKEEWVDNSGGGDDQDGNSSPGGAGEPVEKPLNLVVEPASFQIPIESFSYFNQIELSTRTMSYEGEAILNGEEYLYDVNFGDDLLIYVYTEADAEPILFDFTFALEALQDLNKYYVRPEEATFTLENDGIEMQIIVTEIIEDNIETRMIFFLFM